MEVQHGFFSILRAGSEWVFLAFIDSANMMYCKISLFSAEKNEQLAKCIHDLVCYLTLYF